jgi:hypothetical protein
MRRGRAGKELAGKELFRAVQAAQGNGHISDSVEDMSDKEAKRVAQIALGWTTETARILREFLKQQSS